MQPHPPWLPWDPLLRWVTAIFWSYRHLLSDSSRNFHIPGWAAWGPREQGVTSHCYPLTRHQRFPAPYRKFNTSNVLSILKDKHRSGLS